MDTTTIVWAIGFPLLLFFIAIGTGTVFAMTDSESIGFWVARACFIAAAIDLMGFIVYWLIATRTTAPLNIGLSALVGLITVPALVVSLQWIDATAMRLSTRLVPAGLPNPPLPAAFNNPHVRQDLPANALRVVLGSNLAWATKMPHTVLMMAGEPMITIDRDTARNQVMVKVLRIFDDRNNIIARIDEDGFWVENSTRKKRPDPSTLVVYDHNDMEVLRIVMLNDNTISVTGVFRHAGVAQPVVITPHLMQIGGNTLSESAMGESGLADIAVDAGISIGVGR